MMIIMIITIIVTITTIITNNYEVMYHDDKYRLKG